jgi:hypothetical protein
VNAPIRRREYRVGSHVQRDEQGPAWPLMLAAAAVVSAGFAAGFAAAWWLLP